MKALPESDKSLLLRTDFTDDAAWIALCEAAQAPGEDGFEARLDCISDPAFSGLTVDQLLALNRNGGGRSFAFLADRLSLTSSERPILVVDLHHEPGRTFRVVPNEMWSVENNLSLANMDYEQ